MPADVGSAIDEALGKEETGTFDTHPASRDRIARARASQAQAPCP